MTNRSELYFFGLSVFANIGSELSFNDNSIQDNCITFFFFLSALRENADPWIVGDKILKKHNTVLLIFDSLFCTFVQDYFLQHISLIKP